MRNLLCLFLVLFWFVDMAEGQKKNPTKVKLVSEFSSVEAGASFLLGVYFEVQAPWHVYGKAPGKMGLPTEIDIWVPKGFKVDELLWPKPLAFDQGTEEPGLGYAEPFMVIAKVSVSEHVKANSSFSVQAKLKWLNCSPKQCLLGSEKLEQAFNVGVRQETKDLELIRSWQKRILSNKT